MPTETRHIFFEIQEVCCALLNLRRRCGRSVPVGEVVDPVLEQDESSGNISFRMHVVGDNGVNEKLQADHAELGTALIHFCRQEKIPIPVRARKLVDVVNGSLALICVKEKKDYLPLDDPFAVMNDEVAGEGTNAVAETGEVDTGAPADDRDAIQRRRARLEKIRLRLREKATSTAKPLLF